MQQPIARSPSPASPSFAGLLAALAAPAQKPDASGDGSLPAGWKASPAWNDDGPEDDVATLSYERALRAHARYRTTDQPVTRGADPGPTGLEEPFSAASGPVPQLAARRTAGPKPAPFANPEPDANRIRSTQFERNLKSASITIRMSKVECAQLHRRAAEAGLTVSAYLRSCTFEAESLRAMVKDTLAELRLAKAQSKPADPEPRRRSVLRELAHSLARILTPWRVARA
jgi:hypothetical protein